MVTGLKHPAGAYATYARFHEAWGEAAAAAGAEARVVGSSVEGRALTAFELGRRGAPTVLLTALIHGVEVIGSLALRGLFAALGADPELRGSARFVALPVVNPDALARNLDRLVRGASSGQRCNARGVDLNRNFPRIGSAEGLHPFSGSRFRALPHYAGPHPCSEPESRAVAALAEALCPTVALGFHSFGNLLLYPWGFTRKPHPRTEEMLALGAAFNDALGARPYGVRQASRLYPTTGDLDDWLDSRFSTIAFTVEVGTLDRRLLHPLRFVNPFCWMNPVDVESTVAHVVPGLVALLRAALGLTRAPGGRASTAPPALLAAR